jgi:uncharacterized delta-60 repeat protein
MKHIYIVLLFVLFGSLLSKAQMSGTLDTTFGNKGIISTLLSAEKSAYGVITSLVKRQIDGKFLVVVIRYEYVMATRQFKVSYNLYRFSSDGQLDVSFGVNGHADIKGLIRDIILLPDGKIVLLSKEDEEIVITRLLSTGLPDNSYAFKGKNYTGAYFNAAKFLVQQSGKYMIIGTDENTNVNAFMRLEADGSRDFSFGIDGIKIHTNSLNAYQVVAVKEMPDGKLLIGSQVANARYSVMLRLTDNAEYDSTFSGDGVQRISTKEFYLVDFEVQNDNRIVAGGYYYFNNYAQSALIFSRLKANGTPDSTFGVNGTRTHNFGGTRDQLQTLLLQPDGKIIGGGVSDSNYAIIRLSAKGVVDSTFNSKGKALIPFAGNTSVSSNYINIEPNGKLLMAGSVYYPDSMMRFTMVMFNSGINVGLSELNPPQNITAYPNPTADVCQVQYTLQQAGEVSVQLYNLQGQCLRQEAHTQMKAAGTYLQQIQLTGLPKGMYIIVVNHSTGSSAVKLMKD